MSGLLLKIPHPIHSLSSPQQVLAEWSQEVTNLLANYQAMQTVIQTFFQGDEAIELGQCPLEEFIMLSQTMQAELGKLVNNLDQLDRVEKAREKKFLQKLIAHTDVLSHLNQQVQLRLHLLNHSSS